MIKSTSVHIDIDKIVIPKNIRRSIPGEAKIAERYSFFTRTGCFDREILLDEHNNLIDGYTTYLVCKMFGLTKVRALRIKVKFTTKELLKMAVASMGE